MTGTLYGVGVGPGDPELVTVKAARLIRAADVIAYHSARHGRSIARRIAEPHLRGGQIEEALVYPVTTETTDHPGGYQGAIDEFYAAAAERLAAHLDAGRDVVVLAEGDPLFYGSYMHMHKRLAHRYPTEVVPGVTSVSAASAALGQPLVERDEVLTVLPGTLPRAELARRLADTDSAAVLKLGRTFDNVRGAVADARPLRVLRRARDDGRAAHRRPGRRRPRLGALLRDRPAPGGGRRLPTRPAGRGAPAGRGRGRRHRPGRSRLADPAGRGRALAKPTTSSATAPTWPACRPTRASPGTPATTASRPTAPRTRSTSPPPGAASRSCRAATRVCSRWPQRCWRSRPRTSTPTSRCGCCPG